MDTKSHPENIVTVFVDEIYDESTLRTSLFGADGGLVPLPETTSKKFKRSPLYSTSAIVIVGVLISAARLAAVIYRILQQNRAHKTPRRETKYASKEAISLKIEIGNRRLVFSKESKKEIERALTGPHA
jgi:hypothetical protein